VISGLDAGHLGDPHHDGSPLYLEDPAPTLGSTVRVRVRVPHHPDGTPAAEHVVMRSVRDGEPSVTPAQLESTDETGSWWAADLLMANPLTSYRFLVSGKRSGYRWLNGAGMHDRDVTDLGDFKLSTEQQLPDWVLDQVGYQVFPDRFARTETGVPTPAWAQPAGWDDPVVHRGPDVPFQLYGGTLDGVAAHLDHLGLLGTALLYLTPVFQARSNHRYDAVSFDHVDPVLGGNEALERLIRSAHERGIRVIGDLTTNHTGDAHDWFTRATTDPHSVEREFYSFAADGSYESWLGVPSLPKLDHGSAEMRRRLYEDDASVVARWLRAGLDGWRIDVANMTGRRADEDRTHEVARRIRATMRDLDPQAWLLAEHGHDASLDLRGDGWHGTMDYAGFTRPLWCWLNGGPPGGPGIAHGLQFLGLPVDIPVLGADQVVRTMREVHSAMPWWSWAGSTAHLDSHDTPRFRTVAGGGTDGWVDRAGVGRDRHLAGLALQMTLPGVPVVFMGDEIGLTGLDGEHSRTPYPWTRRDEWDAATLEAYRTWIALRADNVALRRGGLRWVHTAPDSMTFLREHPDQTLLVHVTRDAHAPVRVPWRTLGLDDPRDLRPLAGPAPTAEGPTLLLPGEALTASVLEVRRG